MQRPEKKALLTAATEPMKGTPHLPHSYKAPCCPPAIPPELQLKWGLALLGEQKSLEYLQGLTERMERHIQ